MPYVGTTTIALFCIQTMDFFLILHLKAMVMQAKTYFRVCRHIYTTVLQLLTAILIKIENCFALELCVMNPPFSRLVSDRVRREGVFKGTDVLLT
jgi:hypothetical protein